MWRRTDEPPPATVPSDTQESSVRLRNFHRSLLKACSVYLCERLIGKGRVTIELNRYLIGEEGHTKYLPL